jgi:formate hydrogenlyase subunit 3/multisubunit Na+/H+ antiporter MnhD subunit
METKKVAFNLTSTIQQIKKYLPSQEKVGLESFAKRLKRYNILKTLEYPRTAFVFLLACLGMAGFPITPTMIGEDLIFSSVKEDQYFLAFFLSVSLIIDGLALVRMYARLFLGPHVKTYHSIAYKSS